VRWPDRRPAFGGHAQRHSRGDRTQAVGRIADALQDLRREHGRRLRAVSIAIAGVVREGRLAEPNTFGWGAADLSAIVADSGLPLLIGNDATLAGWPRRAAVPAPERGPCCHLTVEVGLGGVLVVDGVPVLGRSGAAVSTGTLPFATVRCSARAVPGVAWDNESWQSSGTPPRRPRARGSGAFALEVLERADHDLAAAAAVRRVAEALARGIAGLVNAMILTW